MAASEYCSTTEVQEEFKDITWGTGTAIAAARVTRFIQEASAYIEGKIGLIYTTPISSTASPKATLVIKAICIALVADRVRKIMNVKTGSATDSQKASGEAKMDPEKMLQDIVEEKMLLSDASKVSSRDGVQSYASVNALEQTFQKGVKQW